MQIWDLTIVLVPINFFWNRIKLVTTLCLSLPSLPEWEKGGEPQVDCEIHASCKKGNIKATAAFLRTDWCQAPWDGNLHWQVLLFFLTWPWQYLLGYLCFLPKKCQMREEVCTPGEFNLTMPFGERKEREKGHERKEQGQEIGTGEEEEEQWNKQFGGILVWHFPRSFYTAGTVIIKYYGSPRVWEYNRPGFEFLHLNLQRKLCTSHCICLRFWCRLAGLLLRGVSDCIK